VISINGCQYQIKNRHNVMCGRRPCRAFELYRAEQDAFGRTDWFFVGGFTAPRSYTVKQCVQLAMTGDIFVF